MNYDLSFVVTIAVTCYSWAPSSGDHLFTCGAISRPPQLVAGRLHFGKGLQFCFMSDFNIDYIF